MVRDIFIGISSKKISSLSMNGMDKIKSLYVSLTIL